MNELIKFFPRDVGTPFRFIMKNRKEFFKFINNNNGVKNLYFSLYDCDTDRNYERCKIDKIWLETDHGMDLIKKLHNHPKLKNIKHLIKFSGNRGGHIYFFTKDYEFIINKRECIKNAQHYLLNLIKTDDYNPFDYVDPQTIGLTGQLVRFPNTMHIKSSLYCIPITEEDLNKGIKHIREKAREQNFEFIYYGSELLDINRFDYRTEQNEIIDIKKIYTNNNNLDIILPCMKNALLNPRYAKNQVRFYFAKCCADLAISSKVCDDLARKYWSNTMDSTGRKSKYQEFVDERQIDYAYNNDKTFFPSCSKIKKLGLCDKECGKRLYK